LNLNGTFARITASKIGVDQIFKNNLFKTLVGIVTDERINIQALILETCRNCIKSAEECIMPNTAIECNALYVYTEIAKNSLVTNVKVYNN
jgi:hypothetical protein